MKIFLTGGTGFIGSHFINQAHSADHDIIALRRPNSGKPRIKLNREPSWLECEMSSLAPDNFTGCDVLVHLAAHSTNPPYDTLANCITWNVQAPHFMFDKAHIGGVSLFVVAGSCFEYGQSGNHYEFIPTDAPLEPTLSYSASKAAASVTFRAWACEANVRLAILRIFHVYGEGELESRFWPALRNAARLGEDFPMTDGEQVRDFVPVQLVAATFLNTCLREDLIRGCPIIENLGTGHPQSLRSFAESWWKQWEAKGKLLFGALPYRPNEVMRYVPLIETPNSCGSI